MATLIVLSEHRCDYIRTGYAWDVMHEYLKEALAHDAAMRELMEFDYRWNEYLVADLVGCNELGLQALCRYLDRIAANPAVELASQNLNATHLEFVVSKVEEVSRKAKRVVERSRQWRDTLSPHDRLKYILRDRLLTRIRWEARARRLPEERVQAEYGLRGGAKRVPRKQRGARVDTSNSRLEVKAGGAQGSCQRSRVPG